MGSYKIEHRDLPENNKPKLSCHVLPSVNIRSVQFLSPGLKCIPTDRPALVVENIPGLQFIGNQRRPNTKIRVEHVVEREGGYSEEGGEIKSGNENDLIICRIQRREVK